MEKNWILHCLCEDVLVDIRLDFQQDDRCIWRDSKTLEILLILEKEEQWWIKDGTQLQLESQPLKPHTIYPCEVHGKRALLFCEEQSEGDNEYEIFELVPRLTIGRSQCDLLYRSKHISKLHAQIWKEQDTWWIEDMDSGNGVYVNRKRIKKQRLCFGDRIYIMGL